jgi:hypothetical protein
MAILAPPAPTSRRSHHERNYSGGSSNVGGLAKWVAQGAEGQRNNRLHWAACRVGEMAKEHKVAAAAAGQCLVGAAVQTGLEDGEAVRSVNSGFKKSGLGYKP